MNIQEFKIWFEGFAEAIGNDFPTQKQFELLKDKVSSIQSQTTLKLTDLHIGTPVQDPFKTGDGIAEKYVPYPALPIQHPWTGNPPHFGPTIFCKEGEN